MQKEESEASVNCIGAAAFCKKTDGFFAEGDKILYVARLPCSLRLRKKVSVHKKDKCIARKVAWRHAITATHRLGLRYAGSGCIIEICGGVTPNIGETEWIVR